MQISFYWFYANLSISYSSKTCTFGQLDIITSDIESLFEAPYFDTKYALKISKYSKVTWPKRLVTAIFLDMHKLGSSGKLTKEMQ